MIEMLDKWGEGGVLNDLTEGVKIKTVPVNKKIWNYQLHIDDKKNNY